jgi:hypothetical protein
VFASGALPASLFSIITVYLMIMVASCEQCIQNFDEEAEEVIN